MNDLIIAFEMSLMAAGYVKKETMPPNPLLKELVDYVNSKEYRKLIIDEMNNLKSFNLNY